MIFHRTALHVLVVKAYSAAFGMLASEVLVQGATGAGSQVQVVLEKAKADVSIEPLGGKAVWQVFCDDKLKTLQSLSEFHIFHFARYTR